MMFAGRLQVLARLLASVWLLLGATLLMAASAKAQDGAPAPPEPFNVDERGVSLTSGQLVMGSVDVSIGPDGHHGLRLGRQWVQSGWRLDNVPAMTGSSTNPVVSFGGRSIPFKTVSGAYVPEFESGATLSNDRTVFTASDGTRIDFTNNSGFGASGALGQMSLARGTKVTFPDGVEWTFTYETGSSTQTGQVCPPYPCQTYTYTINLVRLSSINSTTGYQLKVTHASNNLPAGISPWLQITKVTAINNAVEYCNPAATGCTLSNTWPEATYSNWFGPLASATGPTNLTTNYTYSGTKLTGIKPPGASSNMVTFGYNASNKVSSVSAGGGTWTYGYPSSTQTTVTDPGSNVRTTNYTSAGLVTSTVAGGQTTQFAYCTGTATCPAGLLQQVTMPEQNKVIYEYDARGNVTRTTRRDKAGTAANDIVTTAVYPSTCSNAKTCNKPTSTTDAKGFRTDYAWSATHGGLTQVQEPAPTGSAPIGSGARPTVDIAYTTTSARYLTGPSTWTTGPAITVTSNATSCATAATCSGTANERVSSVAYPSSSTPNNALPSSVTSKVGDNTLVAPTTLTYDNVGNLTEVDGPLSGTADKSLTFYNAARQPIGAIGPDPDGAGAALFPATKYTYRTDGQIDYVQSGTVTAQTSTALASLTELQRQTTGYDSYHRPIRTVLTGGGADYQVTDQLYDSAGRVLCTMQRMQNTSGQTGWWGNLPSSCSPTQTTGANGPDRVTYNHYDALSRVWKVTTAYGVTGQEAAEQVSSFTANGKLQFAIDAKGNKTEYRYDGHDRLIRTVFPSGTVPGSYDPSSLVNALATAGSVNEGDYEQVVSYDANGNVTSSRTRRNETLTMSYDNLNRLTLKVVPDRANFDATHERDVYFGYDLFGNMTYARFDSASGEGITNAFNALGQLTSTTNNMDGVSRALAYQYDAAGNRTLMWYPDSQNVTYHRHASGAFYYATLNGTAPLFHPTYDAAGRTNYLHRWTTASANWLQWQGYAYDAVSRVYNYWYELAGTTYDLSVGFTFNPASQIASTTRYNDAYAWNGQANVNRTYTSNGLNQYYGDGTATYGDDMNGNLASATNVADGTGSFDDYSYTYDVENRLVGQVFVNRSSGGTQTITTTLRYDPLGRLHEVADSSMGTRRFLYDGSDLVAEYNTTGTLLRRYVHGLGAGDDPLVWFEGSGVADSARRYLYADERGSIVAATDSNGNVTNVSTYDEYGIPGSSNAGAFQYTGQVWLPELGMYHYKARMYSPTLGRFMQTDPIGYGDGLNMYAYVGGDPVNRIDPSGLFDVPSGLCENWSIIEWQHRVNDPSRTPVDGYRTVGEYSYCPPRDAFEKWQQYRTDPVGGAGGGSGITASADAENCETSGVNDLVKRNKRLAKAVATVRAAISRSENEFGFEVQLRGRGGISISDITNGVPGEVVSSKGFALKNLIHINFGALYFHGHGLGWEQQFSQQDKDNGDGFGEAMSVLITEEGLQCSRPEM